MRFLFRSLAGLVIVGLTLGLLWLAAWQIGQAVAERRDGGGGPRPREEQVFVTRLVEITPERVTPVMEVFGEVVARQRLVLRPRQGGRVLALSPDLHEGGRVAAGDVLVRLDPADARAARLTQQAALDEAEAGLIDARRRVEIAEGDLAAAEAQGRLRDEAVARQRQLAERGLGTSSEREVVELAASTAAQAVLARKSALADAESAVGRAEIAVARAQIALEEAQRAEDDTVLTAPFDGRVTAVSAVEGGLVSPNEQIAEIFDPARLEVRLPLSLAQFGRLAGATGQLDPLPVQVTLDGSGGAMAVTGRLDRAAGSVVSGEAGRVVFVSIPEGEAGPLRPGDFVTARIAEPPLDDAAILPAAAVGGDGAVLVAGEDGRLSAVPVQVLRRQGDEVVIAAAALTGARVVAERVPQLGAGVRVRDAAQPAGEGDDREAGSTGRPGARNGTATHARPVATAAAESGVRGGNAAQRGGGSSAPGAMRTTDAGATAAAAGDAATGSAAADGAATGSAEIARDDRTAGEVRPGG